MKVCIYGAGAIGGWIGARLARSGAQVSVVARGATLEALQLHGLVAYHDFEGITIHADETPRLLKNIGDKPAVILRNHGLLSWGRTLPLAFVRLWTLQRACDVQVAQAALGPATPVPEHVAAKTVADSFQWDQKFGAGQDVFDALQRRLDRIDPSYQS